MNLIQTAIDEGDHTTVTSILGAPAYLSGLDPKMAAVLVRKYHERHNPQQSKRLKAMQAAKAHIENRAPLIFPEFERATKGTSAKAKKIREANDAAEKLFNGV